MTAPDLRTAAQALLDRIEGIGECPFCKRRTRRHGKVEHYNDADGQPCPADRVVSALAAGATEPPADPGGVVAEILADYGDDLTNADDRVEAINRIASALTPGSAPNPEGADEPAVIWTCPPCRRGEHGDCMDAGTGTCQCAQNDHGTAAGVPDEPGDDDPMAWAERVREALTEVLDADEVARIRSTAFTSPSRGAACQLLADSHEKLRAEVERLRAAAPASEDDERKPWTFDVQFEGGPQPVDYGTGTEWDGSWQWAIYDGPHELDDVVLSGMADDDPTAVLAALVAEHNRAGSPPPTPAPTREQEALKLYRDYYSASEAVQRGIVDFDLHGSAVDRLENARAAVVAWQTEGPPGTAVEVRAR